MYNIRETAGFHKAVAKGCLCAIILLEDAWEKSTLQRQLAHCESVSASACTPVHVHGRAHKVGCV